MKYGVAIALLLWVSSCQGEHEKELANRKLKLVSKNQEVKTATPVIKEYDFGHLKLGDSIEYVFHVKNTGMAPVVMENVKASCGCTTVDWMKKPVPAGETGWIKSRFKAVDKGRIRKSVVAQLNTKDPFIVFYLTGEVTSSDSLEKN